MKYYTKQHYLELRSKYQVPANLALQYAKTFERWEFLGENVRLRYMPEEDNYFNVCGKSDFGPSEDRRIERMIQQTGLWYVVAEYKCPKCGQYQHGDSIGMIIGNDPLSFDDNCYLYDLMATTLDAIGDCNE